MTIIRANLAIAFLCTGSLGAEALWLKKLDRILEEKGVPAVLAASHEIRTDEKGNHFATFYGVTRPAESFSPKAPEGILVFSSDPRFRWYEKYHLKNIEESKYRVASTMFGSTETAGTTIEIVNIEPAGNGSLVFRGRIRIAYLESNAKGQLPTREMLKK